MFGIGEGELMIILVFGFLLFGPDKLPQMGRTIGRALRQFRETQEKMTSVVQSEIIDPVSEAANAPLRPRKSAVDDDIDADIDDDLDDDADAEGKAPKKKETFAERRARLAAEKAAAEGGEKTGTDADSAAADAAEDDDEAVADDENDASAGMDDVADAAIPEPEPELDPEAQRMSDLYARRPRKRKAVVDELAAELAADGATSSDQDATSEGGER